MNAKDQVLSSIISAKENHQSVRKDEPKQKEEKKVIKFNVSEPLEFNELLKTHLTTLSKLHALINIVFSSTINEYEGCMITPNQYGELVASLYFNNKTNQDSEFIKIISPTRNPSFNGAADFVERYGRMTSGKVYEIQDEFRSLFKDFMYSDSRYNQNIKVDNHVSEVIDNTPTGQKVYLCLNNVDVLKVVKMAYSSQDKDNPTETYDYNISIIRPLPNNDYIISIQKLSNTALNKLGESIGMSVNVGSNIPMNRSIIL